MARHLRPYSSVPRLTRLEDRLAPAVATWDRGGTNNLWTTSANWVGDVAPQPGDDLVFPGFPTAVAQVNNMNDFAAGTAFRSVRLGPARYVVTGNSITLAAGITTDSLFSQDYEIKF